MRPWKENKYDPYNIIVQHYKTKDWLAYTLLFSIDLVYTLVEWQVVANYKKGKETEKKRKDKWKVVEIIWN